MGAHQIEGIGWRILREWQPEACFERYIRKVGLLIDKNLAVTC